MDYLEEILKNNNNPTITDSFFKANSVINSKNYERILCSISGGSDSDVMMDLIHKVDYKKKVKYIWFDTGLEYSATKKHLTELSKRYNVEIIKCPAIKPIPLACKEYGQPFLSKQISEFIDRLQRHNFKWEDEDFEILLQKYPKCRSALRWWCNLHAPSHNINQRIYLKEFMITHPPTFKISNKCCQYAKKDVARQFHRENNISRGGDTFKNI